MNNILNEGFDRFMAQFQNKKALKESTKRDDIDADADDKKEKAKAMFMKKKDDADSDKDYKLKKAEMKEPRQLKESDKPAATSIEDAQKWVDYDMKRYHKISDKTNDLIKKAGFQIIKDDHGDYEVAAGKYESMNEESNMAKLKRAYPELNFDKEEKKTRAKRYTQEALKEAEEEFMTVEDFLKWHDDVNHYRNNSWAFNEIYSIFDVAGCNDEYVDVCYEKLSDEDKIKVTEIIKRTKIAD